MTRSLALSTVSSYLRYGISFLVSFLLVPFMIQKLGTEGFGLWSFLFSLLGIFGLADIGFGVGVVKVSAECKGAGDPEKRNRTLSAIFFLYLLLASASGLGLFLVATIFPSWVAQSSQSGEYVLTLFWLLALRTVILQIPLGLFRGALFGEQKIVLVNVISLLQNLAYGLMAWQVLANGYGLVAVAVASLIAMVGEHVLYVVACYWVLPNFRLSLERRPLEELKELFSFSRHQFLSDVASMVLLQVDLILVRALFGLHEVALYALALRLSTHGYYLVKQFVNVLAPYVADAVGAGREDELSQVVFRGTRTALLSAIPIWLSVCFLGGPLLYCWTGPDTVSAYPLLFILTTSMLIGIPPLVASVVLAMSGDHVYTSRTALIGLLANLCISICLGYWLGLVGIALGTLLSKTVIDYYRIVGRILQRFHVSPWEWWSESIGPLLAPSLVHLAILFLLRSFWDPVSLLDVAIQGGLGAAGFFALFSQRTRLERAVSA